VIHLKASYTYMVIPPLSTHAYLKVSQVHLNSSHKEKRISENQNSHHLPPPPPIFQASIQNTSEGYPFLAGDINVFMDGNFVAKSHIKVSLFATFMMKFYGN